MKLTTNLKATQAQTLTFFNLPDTELSKQYAVGKWTIRQILNHLTDAETVLYERIRRVISKPNQVIWGFDQEAWAEKLQYDKFPLAINKAIFRATRTSIIYLAEEYYEALGQNEFVHNETGKRTLKDEFDKVLWHNQAHIDQILKALG